MSILPHMVGNYRVVAQLGQGGMARALLAMRQGPGGFRKLFVVKQLRLDLCDDPDFVGMFLDEARLAALLNHPNVVQTHEIGEDANSRFISMDYLEGQSLGRVLHRAGREHMPLHLYVRILAESLAGLQYAHQLTDLNGSSLSVVHRDISPGNIFLTYDGQVKLLDFGIAKATGARFHTEVGILKGKLSYMAPEQALTKDVDCRADVFAVGVMLWEAMAGRRLVPRGEPDPVTFNNRTKGLWDSIESVNPGAPAELKEICAKAMALDLDERYQTAKEFRTALLGYLSKSGEEPSTEDLSALVCGLFAKERQQIAKTIAKTISQDRPFDIDKSMLDPWNTATGATASSSMPLPAPPSITPRHQQSQVGPLSQVGPASQVRQGYPPQGRSPDDVEIEILPTRAQIGLPKNGMGKILVAGLGVVAVAMLVLFISKSGEPKQKPVASNLATEPVRPAVGVEPLRRETADQEDEMVSIVVSVVPSTATIDLDGDKLPNPFVGKKLRMSGSHKLVISAPDHETMTRTINFERDRELTLALKPIPVAPTVTQRSGPSAAERARRSAAQKKNQQRLIAQARAEARAEAKAEAEAKAAKLAKIEAAAKRSTRKSKDREPRKATWGDDLSQSRNKKNRKIDEENPYK